MLKEWLESAKALYRMYRVLANHTINKTDDSEEYKNILSLLEDAIRFEKQKIQKLSFNPDTITQMYEEIASYCNIYGKCTNPNIYLNDEEYVAASRLYNAIVGIDIEISRTERPSKCDDIFELLSQITDYENYVQKKLQAFYINHITINYIYVLSLAEGNPENDFAHELIARLMFYSIFLTPSYEDIFKITKTIQKPITITDYSYEMADEIEKTVLENYIETTLTKMTDESLTNILKLSDFDLEIEEVYSNYIKDMIEILARLISFKATTKLDEIIDKFEKDLISIDTQEKKRIVKDIYHMFTAAKKILTSKNKGKELSYGNICKESN